MKRLAPDDSGEKHIKTANYHIHLCRQRKSETLFLTLLSEAEQRRDALIAQRRALEDQQQRVDDLSADFDYAERVAEDAVRDVDADLDKLDRENPTLGARERIFPGGYGVVIAFEGEQQIIALDS